MSEDERDRGKQPGFKISDRRSFGEAAATEPADTQAPPENLASEGDPQGDLPQGPTDESDPGHLPPVDFHTFILSLGSSALLHLGELDPPEGGEARPDLRLAKHTIDIIGMLQAKTRGNLSPPEERLIESLLYDLRLRYVERG